MNDSRQERHFQASIIKELKEMFRGCLVVKLDPNYIQGLPDLLVLYEDKWATLECKQNAKARHRPNQDYYVELMDDMSFSRFVFPENKEEVMDELRKAFGA